MTDPDGPGARPRGSVARSAFSDAQRHLAAHPPARSRRVPYDYAVPHAPAGVGAPPGDVLPAVRGVTTGAAGPLHDAARRLRDREVTAVQLLQEALDAVELRNEELVGVVALDVDAAMDQAVACDRAVARGDALGPLHGIPLTVKDVIDVAGLPTRCGSVAYEDVPGRDAVPVARLRAAGAVPFAKVATHEFALGVTSPQSRNPWDPKRIPGGSSGGSAVAVATGMGLGSLGTDTRASIRVPAALSGVVGFKPTYGRVPTGGIVSLSWTMDHPAVMATTVPDAALLLDVLLGRGAGLDAVTPHLVPGTRVGVVRSAYDGASDPVAAAVDGAVSVLEKLGATVVDASAPTLDDLETANAAGLLVSRVEAASFHRSLALDRSRYWEEVADQLEHAADVSGIDYVDAQRVRADLADRMLALFADHDVLVMPTAPVVAPPADDFARFLMVLSRNAIPWSFVGFPALSVPCGSVDGLPVGLQLVAAPDREDVLGRVGSAYERAV